MSTQENSELSTKGRLASLVIGASYLVLVTIFFSYVTDASLPVTAIFVVAGTAAIIASLAIFCVKLVSIPPGTRRVKLSTLILLFIPLSIYLAGISRILQTIPEGEVSMFGWLVLAALFALFIVGTTAILLRFGEAIIWLVLRFRRRQPQNRDS